jgi:hydrogenase-4 component F
MPLQWAIVFLPWLGAAGAGRRAGPPARDRSRISASARHLRWLAVALAALPFGQQHGWTRTDALNLPFVAVAAFVGLTTAVFSAATLDAEGFDHWRIRAYHAAFQVFMGAQFLALLSDNSA